MNVLAIGAHFDDIELGCSGSLAKHVAAGDHVTIYVATKSGFVSPDNVTVRSDDEAMAEGKAAAELIGGSLVCGGFETLHLEFEDELNSQLVHLIEQEKIDLIYTHHKGDVHHDHLALAKASLHAGRHVPRILTYHSNWYQSDESFAPDFYVDITDTWSKKEEVIKAHKSEYERVGDAWIDYFKKEAINYGFASGVRLAEGFRCVKWLV